MPLFKRKNWDISNGLVTINIIVALVSTLITTVLTIITLLKHMD